LRVAFVLVDRRGLDACTFGCETFGIFLVERRFSIAMFFFCFEALVSRAWRADAYVVSVAVSGRACGGFLGRSVGGVTLGRGTGCAILSCFLVMGATLGGRAGLCVISGVIVWAGTLGSGAGCTAGVAGVSFGDAWSVVVLPKISLSLWRFCRVTASSVGRRLSWSVAVSAAVSSCAAASMRASLDAIGILMSYAGNHRNV